MTPPTDESTGRSAVTTANPKSALVCMSRRFLRDTSGSTAIEYGLIVGLIFLAIVTSLRLFADRTGAMFEYIATNISKAT